MLPVVPDILHIQLHIALDNIVAIIGCSIPDWNTAGNISAGRTIGLQDCYNTIVVPLGID